jgi:hypothetical protein
MPLFSQKPRLKVDFWRAFGHSWIQYQTGPSGDQTGRVDALFRSALDVEYNSWRNYGSSGARIVGGGRSLGGWTKAMQRAKPPVGRVGPYAPDGGGTLLVYGINDMSIYGGNLANTRASMVEAHKALISWARSSRFYLTPDAVFAYGAGWTSNASGLDLGMGTVDRLCSTTTAATITMTLPADYKGEPVCFAFLRNSDSTGVTITWSGTALSSHALNGTTFNTGQGIEAAFSTFGYQVERVVGLTSANASQTIILTTTARDGGTGSGFFDGAWLESLTPAPVVVCNVSRPTTAGYAALATFSTKWTSADSASEAAHDANVVSYNADLLTMTQEFDAMVQVADCDAIVGKVAAAFSDGIHPNEYGAGQIVDAMLSAIDRMSPPVTASSSSICFNPPSPRVSGRRRPRTVNNWYTSDYLAIATATYTPAAGNFVAVPFDISESREQFNQMCMEVTTAGVASTIRWGIYEDVNWDGYPGELLAGMDISSAGAFTVVASTGVKTSATFTTAFVADPGLYWLAMKIDTLGAGQVFKGMTGPSPFLPNLTTTGVSIAGGYMGWQVTGQASGALPGSFPAGGVLVQSPPMIGLKKSK